jgi:hypothetical protein
VDWAAHAIPQSRRHDAISAHAAQRTVRTVDPRHALPKQRMAIVIGIATTRELHLPST